MPSPVSPTALHRWLARELRRLREARGMAQGAAARACGWSGARLSYLETGQRPVVAADLDVLLPLYDVPEAEREPYYDAVNKAKQAGWWERFDYLVEDRVSVYIGLEQGASRIRTFEPLVVPGILQTADYARDIMSGGLRRRGGREVDRLVELRIERQAILTRAKEPTELDAVIDESVLHRSTATPDVLGRQLRHLADMAALPHITLQVLPLEGGVQSFVNGPFSILSFPSDRPDPMVYLEHRGGALWLEEFDAVERYALAFDGLADMALDPEMSLATVREAAERQPSK
jgi:transcriptional regulator with XRE-family HTH domain